MIDIYIYMLVIRDLGESEKNNNVYKYSQKEKTRGKHT